MAIDLTNRELHLTFSLNTKENIKHYADFFRFLVGQKRLGNLEFTFISVNPLGFIPSEREVNIRKIKNMTLDIFK